MSTLYFLALCGVCVVVLGVMFDAVIGISRKPPWHSQRPALAVLAEQRPLVKEISVLDVEPRHSGFAGLINNEEWRMTA